MYFRAINLTGGLIMAKQQNNKMICKTFAEALIALATHWSDISKEMYQSPKEAFASINIIISDDILNNWNQLNFRNFLSEINDSKEIKLLDYQGGKNEN
tara:strand:- start:2851 stop:3147 length:297 start_codon:yes stop_codon:yes gene_type:complete